MTVEAIDFTTYAGNSHIINGTATNSAAAVINLTGASIDWAMYLMNSEEALVEKSVGSGIAVVVAASGTYRVTLSPADTEGLDPHTYYHEVKVTESGGSVWTVATGIITLMPSRI